MSAVRMSIAASGGHTSPVKRHFLDLDQVPAAELRAIVAEAKRRKHARADAPKAQPDVDAPLDGRALAMVFEKPSTRTRVSFEMAIRQLGGSAIVLNGGDLQLGRGETISDTARVLSGYVDAIMLRTGPHEALLELARHASAPVINGLTDRSHPCQIMADLLTIDEKLGRIEGVKIAWFGDGNNVAATFAQAAPAFGFELAIASPEGLAPDAEIIEAARASGAAITVTEDVEAAIAGAHVVVTDTWLSMHTPKDEAAARMELLAPYQVDEGLMAKAEADAIFMHCLPAHRGEEATAAVMDGAQSVIFEEAENRLHAQKAVLLWCFGAL